MSKAKVDEWLHADRGSPWKRDSGGGVGGMLDYAGQVYGGLARTPSTTAPLKPTAQRMADLKAAEERYRQQRDAQQPAPPAMDMQPQSHAMGRAADGILGYDAGGMPMGGGAGYGSLGAAPTPALAMSGGGGGIPGPQPNWNGPAPTSFSYIGNITTGGTPPVNASAPQYAGNTPLGGPPLANGPAGWNAPQYVGSTTFGGSPVAGAPPSPLSGSWLFGAGDPISNGAASSGSTSPINNGWYMNRGGGVRRDAGGILPTPDPSTGGAAPTAMNASPLMQQQYQRLLSLPPEKLQELSVRLPPGSPMGRIVQQALQLQRMKPQQAAQPQQQQPQPQQPQSALGQGSATQAVRRGGNVKGYQGGGSPLGMPLSMASPWWERAEERGSMASGYLHGPTAGRADNITTTAPGGSYVVPADVLAGLGEGNGLFGARVWGRMLDSYIHGAQPPRGRAHTIPRPPPIGRDAAKGGGVQGKDGIGQPVPVKLSHGELVEPPHRVLAVGRAILRKHGGHGSTKIAMKVGHDFLDQVVLEARKRHVEKLKSLPGPTR